jgi:hypothetical protein
MRGCFNYPFRRRPLMTMNRTRKLTNCIALGFLFAACGSKNATQTQATGGHSAAGTGGSGAVTRTGAQLATPAAQAETALAAREGPQPVAVDLRLVVRLEVQMAGRPEAAGAGPAEVPAAAPAEGEPAPTRTAAPAEGEPAPTRAAVPAEGRAVGRAATGPVGRTRPAARAEVGAQPTCVRNRRPKPATTWHRQAATPTTEP